MSGIPVFKPQFKFTKSDRVDTLIQKKYSLKNHDSKLNSILINGRTYSTYFSSKQMSKIYNSPSPNLSNKTTIGVISLGGGLFGSITNNVYLPNGKIDSNSGTLINGDIQKYWNWQGIPSSNWPTVIIKSIDGTTNSPSAYPYSSNYGPTIENTLDVETIGSWCSSSNITIIMYLAQNNNFYGAVNYAINSNVIIDRSNYIPSVISISWGAPETLFDNLYVNNFNNLLSNAARKGINICAASGDSYSKDGLTSNVLYFPSSSPWVVACGGTSIVCPGNIYTDSTVESVWNDANNQGGTCGGKSIYFSKPSYQSNIMSNITMRCVPDISLNSDPYTGMVYYINNSFMEGIGGTSTAAPAMAGVIASLHISTFINPILYKINSNCFHDITKGNNIGYSATKGYDLCTGLGSIKGDVLFSSINSLINQSLAYNMQNNMASPYFIYNRNINISPSDILSFSSRTWFTSKELATIYNSPPVTDSSNVIGVISLGGGLFGSYNPATGILTNGDVQKYWNTLGIAPSNHPKVIIKLLNKSKNTPSSNPSDLHNYNATTENTIDVETIGSWCPSQRLTIIVYLANQYIDKNSFYNTIDYALNSNVVFGTTAYPKPKTISISWGFTEIFNIITINSIQPLLAKASSLGINILCATGDNGSTDGVPGKSNYTNFPASSPDVIACGGTTLSCPNYVYDSSTGESTWGSGGGGISRIYNKPNYQSKITQSLTKRCIPDISLNANPSTGIYYIIGGKGYVMGGTSTVAPAMAAVLSILNISYFLNTKLYGLNSQCFHDITIGNNGGYNAGPGYDLCTGLGSIDGVNLQAFLNPIPLTGIILLPTRPTIKVNGVVQLTATTIPPDATNQIFSWSSSNPKIVSVSPSGLCTGKSMGSSVITVSQGNINTKTTVSVKLKLSTKNINLEFGKTCVINLPTVSNSEYKIINNSESIVEHNLINNILTLHGKSVGEGQVLIESNDDTGILCISVA
jgi:subtilase family serine protease